MYCFKLSNIKGDKRTPTAWIMTSGLITKDVWLAGGSLRTFVDQNESIVDYDLFFKNKETNPFLPIELTTDRNDGEVLKTRDKLEKLGFKITFECPEGKMYTYEREYCPVCNQAETKQNVLCQAVSFHQKVQLICENFYSSPEELLATFDLTPCIFATDGEFLWAYKSAIKGVRTKQVRLNKLTYPIATLKRLIKYGKKGYNTNLACKDFVLKLGKLMVGNLMGVDTISFPNEVKEIYEVILSEDQLRQYID